VSSCGGYGHFSAGKPSEALKRGILLHTRINVSGTSAARPFRRMERSAAYTASSRARWCHLQVGAGGACEMNDGAARLTPVALLRGHDLKLSRLRIRRLSCSAAGGGGPNWAIWRCPAGHWRNAPGAAPRLQCTVFSDRLRRWHWSSVRFDRGSISRAGHSSDVRRQIWRGGIKRGGVRRVLVVHALRQASTWHCVVLPVTSDEAGSCSRLFSGAQAPVHAPYRSMQLCEYLISHTMRATLTFLN